MTALSGLLVCPQHRGPRAGAGSVLQLPNCRRRSVPGGMTFGFVETTRVRYGGGGSVTLATDDQKTAILFGGATSVLDIDHFYYVTFILPGQAQLYACKQDDWDAVSGAQDMVRLGYHTDHHDIPMCRFLRACLPTAPLMAIAIGNLAGGDVDAPGTAARLSFPGAMAPHPDGSMWFVDTGNHKIKRFDQGTLAVTTVLTDSGLLPASFGGLGSALAIAPNGDVYYSASHAGVVHFWKIPHGSTTPVDTAITSQPDLNCAVTPDGLYLLRCEGLFGGNQVLSYDTATLTLQGVWAGDGDFPSDSAGTFPNYTSPTRNASKFTAMMPDIGDIYFAPDGSALLLGQELGGLTRINPDNSVTRLSGTGSLDISGDTGESDTGAVYIGDGADCRIQYSPPPAGVHRGSFGGTSLDVSACFDITIASSDGAHGIIRVIGKDLIAHTLAGAQRDNVYPPVYPPLTLAEGETVGANSKQLPAHVIGVRAIPRGLGGGVWATCGNAIIKIS